MALTKKQQDRLGRLLLAGVPLPIALPIAMDPDPIQSATDATMGVSQLAMEASDALSGVVKKAAKRKASPYNKRFAKAYRAIKKKAPRTKHVNIMKQAHKQARRKK